MWAHLRRLSHYSLNLHDRQREMVIYIKAPDSAHRSLLYKITNPNFSLPRQKYEIPTISSQSNMKQSLVVVIHKNSMGSDIQLLKLADGIKDALVDTGFLTIKSILSSTTSDISRRVGVDLYIAQIIFQEAKRVVIEMTKVSTILDASPAFNPITPAAVAIEKKEINLV